MPRDDIQALAWLTVAPENGAAPTELPGVLRPNMSAEHQQEAARLAQDVRRQCRVD